MFNIIVAEDYDAVSREAFKIVKEVMIVLYAFTVKGNDVLTFQFTFANFARFFQDSIFPSVLWRSLKMAVITTLICIAIGYPAAYCIARLQPNRQAVTILLLTIPMWINMPRTGYDKDEVFHYNKVLKQKLADLWNKVKISN